MTVHYRAEGRYSYAVLLFAPVVAAVRPVRSGAQGARETLRATRLHHRRCRAPAFLPALHSRRGRQRGPAAQHLARDAAEQSAGRGDPQGDYRPRDLGTGKPRREGRGEIRENLGSFRPGAEGRHLRGFREARAAARARALRHDRRQGALAQAICRRPEAEPDRHLLSGRRERRSAEIQPEARSGARARHRGAAAERSGRCVLDHDAARASRESRSSR